MSNVINARLDLEDPSHILNSNYTYSNLKKVMYMDFSL